MRLVTWSWLGSIAVLAVGCQQEQSNRIDGDFDGDDDDDDGHKGGDADSDADDDGEQGQNGGDADSDGDGDGDVDGDTDADGDGDDSEQAQEPDPEEPVEPPACEDAEDETVTLFMSADDSNSQAAPVIVRQLIEAGAGIQGSLRTHEFLNYYGFDYAPADAGRLRIVPQLRDVPDDLGASALLVGVVAPELDPDDRRPFNLTFSVDTSGSMMGAPLENAREVMRVIASQLQEGDAVSVVSWDDSVSVVLDSLVVDGPSDRSFLAAIEELEGGGSTDLEQGLSTAYELAEANYAEGGLNRVILISDGGANTGITSEELIAAEADDAEREGIYLVGIGTSTAGAYSDHLMDRVTDLGKGAYVYIDSPEEAEAMFTGSRLLANLEIVARDVRLSMAMPAGYVVEEFHGEEISEDPEEVRPQHLAPNDAMLYHLELRNCSAEVNDGSESFTFAVEWEDPFLRRDATAEVSLTADQMRSAIDSQQQKADAIIAYATALSAVWDLPADEQRPYLDGVRDRIAAVLEVRQGDADLVEIQGLLETYATRF